LYSSLTMIGLATITSKRQLTIPVAVFRKAGFRNGQKVLLQEDKGVVKIRPVTSIIEMLAGSVTVPKRFQGRSPNQILKLAKKEYFAKRTKK